MEMATSMRRIFAIFLAVVCECQLENPGGSSSWGKLQISPDMLSSMEYGNLQLKIYDHAKNRNPTTTDGQKKYFYSPMALLDQSSVVSSYNEVTKQSEMRFQLEMWNVKVQNEVVKYLNEIVGQDIKSNQVTVIPLEKVILTSNIRSTDYSLSPFWTIYDMSKTLSLSLTCYHQDVCDELANQMRTNPQKFDHLKLLYSLSSQTSQTKQTTISIDSVTSGQLVSTLLQKFEDKNEIFLTAKDEKKMLTETAANIRMDTFDDFEVGSLDIEPQLLSILKGLLVTSTETIEKQSKAMWDSVFWNDDNYRPDKTTKTLNRIVDKLDSKTQNKLTEMFQKTKKQLESEDESSSNNEEERNIGTEQDFRENQSNETHSNETQISQGLDQEKQSRNKTRDHNSQTTKVSTGLTFGGVGFNLAVENYNNDDVKRENENTDRSQTNSDEEDKHIENKDSIQNNYDSNSWDDVDIISSTISEKMANNSDSSGLSKISKNEIAKLLQESKDYVQWDGEKFIPKQMQLSKINLGKFRDSQLFQNQNVRVSYTTAELLAPIKFLENLELTVTDEWKNLKDEIKASTALLTTTVNNLINTNVDLSNATRDLTFMRIELNSKLEGTEVAIEKTKIDLEETRSSINNFSAHLNENKKELVKIAANLTMDSNKLRQDLKIAEDELRQDLKATEEKLKGDLSLRATLNDLETTNQNLASTRTELNSTKSAVVDLTRKINSRTNEIIEIARMPTSCADLQQMGHKLSGFFLVNGSKKIEIVFCDFYPNKNAKQKWIGQPNVKSAPVHFYVQRSSSFVKQLIPIPFDFAVVNEGNAMNLTSGIFTAPRPGMYFFSFTGMVYLNSSSTTLFNTWFNSYLYLNGNRMWGSFVQKTKIVVNQYSPLSFQTTLNLKYGDRVWISVQYSSKFSFLFDDVNQHWTQFTGLMLEEEIVASF